MSRSETPQSARFDRWPQKCDELQRPAARPAAVARWGCYRWQKDWRPLTTSRKKELAALDLDDMLILARKLLAGPEPSAELRRRLAGQTRLLLVDEFQDTDPLQVELVRALCDGQVDDGRLFVGDYKQSIYRFRGADPQVFRDLRGEIPAAGQLPLTRNFRSQPAVIEFVNRLFAEEMGPHYEPLGSIANSLVPCRRSNSSGPRNRTRNCKVEWKRRTARKRTTRHPLHRRAKWRPPSVLAAAKPSGSRGDCVPCSTAARSSSGTKARPASPRFSPSALAISRFYFAR